MRGQINRRDFSRASLATTTAVAISAPARSSCEERTARSSPGSTASRSSPSAAAAEARSKVEALSKDSRNRRLVVWHGDVVRRYERQQAGTAEPFKMEPHAIRLGDVAIATNVFELFTESGIQIKARSRALQTFVIQLAGPGSYLATARAVRGGGYSAIAESNLVSPEGGQILVDRTVGLINSLWPGK